MYMSSFWSHTVNELYIFCAQYDQCDSLSSFVQLYKEIEICPKTTKVIQFDRDESCAIGFGNNAVQFTSVFIFLLFVPFSVIYLSF